MPTETVTSRSQMPELLETIDLCSSDEGEKMEEGDIATIPIVVQPRKEPTKEVPLADDDDEKVVALQKMKMMMMMMMMMKMMVKICLILRNCRRFKRSKWQVNPRSLNLWRKDVKRWIPVKLPKNQKS